MPLLKKITSSFAVFVIALLTGQAALAADNDKFDIVGVTLGMTHEEALQALRDYGIVETSLSERRMHYMYSDGINHNYKTEDFLHSLGASKKEVVNAGKRQSDNISLIFSPPPLGGRVVVVRRVLKNEIDPITGGQFRDALIGKYGEPAATGSGALNWKFGGGTKNCVNSSTKGMGITLPGQNKSILDVVHPNSGTGGYMLDRFNFGRTKSLNECASMLEYSIAASGGMPAIQVSATMIDVQSWVKADLAAGEAVEKLRQEAVEKREGKGKKPAL